MPTRRPRSFRGPLIERLGSYRLHAIEVIRLQQVVNFGIRSTPWESCPARLAVTGFSATSSAMARVAGGRED